MGKIIFSVIVLTFLASMAYAEPLTKEQGDAILSELKQIRNLLERQQGAQQPAAPKPDRAAVKISGKDYVLGKADAPLTLINYTDYQCPFCNRFDTTTFAELKKNYIDTGKLRYIVRDYPLPFHQQASKAAQATRCAGEQGKYWQMRETLVSNKEKLDPDSLSGYAKELGLNMGQYDSCMASDRFPSELKSEMDYAGTLGVTGTPTFFIGKTSKDVMEGQKIVGAQPYGSFEAVIKQLASQN